MRELNYKKVENEIVKFIKTEFKKAGFTKAVIGISGGIDSSVSACLAVKALGKKNVHGILMPYSKIKASAKEDVADGIAICEHLGIDYNIQDITKVVDSMSSIMEINSFAGDDNMKYLLRRGNICTRVRMIVLFDFSSANKALVLGTENKTESASKFKFNDSGKYCIGDGGFAYFTMFGDSASCIEPICSLYKTEIFGLAKHLKLPEFIIKKVPSARLWDSQSDESEMGITYAEADEILYFINEEGWLPEHFDANGVWNINNVLKVFELKKKGAFKSNLPVKMGEF
jgi:NAD+ synthase